MNKLIYKIKNRFFRMTKESNKQKKQNYEELIKYKNFIRKINNNFVLSFGAGRSGQNCFSKIFNIHQNWIGTCERFADYEAFYRYISYYNLPIDKQNFFNLLELSSNRDMAKYQNTFISSPYFGFGVEELYKKLKPNYLIFNIRNPIDSIQSFYQKGWYLNYNDFINNSPSIDITNNLYRSFSRIIPKDDYLNEWSKLTRIGKLTWFWTTINKTIYNSFIKIQNVEKLFVKLEDVDQNYEMYEKLSERFNFKKKLKKKSFENVLIKSSNFEFDYAYEYKDWSKIEKKEFVSIIEKNFQDYDKIKTII
jgi:hypothetical protein